MKVIRDDQMKTKNHILRGLSNNSRLTMLSMINENDMKISEISKKMKMTIPGVQKHLNKLLESSLIEKKPGGFFSLSQYGRIMKDEILFFEFLEENKDFLRDHSLMYIPSKFRSRIGELKKFETITDIVLAQERWKKVMKESKKFVKQCCTHISLDLYSNGVTSFRENGSKMQFILSENAFIPKGWKKSIKDHDEIKLTQHGKLEKKMIKDLNIMIWVSENEAAMYLPYLDGTMDLNYMLVSKDEHFREWCMDYFDYLWSKSHSFIESKIQER